MLAYPTVAGHAARDCTLAAAEYNMESAVGDKDVVMCDVHMLTAAEADWVYMALVAGPGSALDIAAEAEDQQA